MFQNQTDLLCEITLKYKPGSQRKGPIGSSEEAIKILRTMYDPDTLSLTECFICLFLDRANQTIGWMKLSQGGINGTVTDVRLLVATAIKCAASSVIISHNHPSGNITPSEADKTITKRIGLACKLFDIQVLDHVIITQDAHYSFSDNGVVC